MEVNEKQALFAIVRAALVALGEAQTIVTIYRANDGQLTNFVTNENLHLFRQYRNRVSANPWQLISEAQKNDSNAQ